VLIVVFVTTGDSAFVDSTQRQLDEEDGLSVSPRRRVVKYLRFLGYWGLVECGIAMDFMLDFVQLFRHCILLNGFCVPAGKRCTLAL
jgi:hypothetical protein